MRIHPTTLPGVLLIEPAVHGDERGFFMETYRRDVLREAGINAEFVQDNASRSSRHILRGLHFQHPYPQGKLVRVTAGRVFDVAVDVRRGSPDFGRWFGRELSTENKLQMWIPPGFAHGFCVVSETADFTYKCTEYYHPETEQTILWDDPDIGIEWPADGFWRLSAKDAAGKRLRDLPDLPAYTSGGDPLRNTMRRALT